MKVVAVNQMIESSFPRRREPGDSHFCRSARQTPHSRIDRLTPFISISARARMAACFSALALFSLVSLTTSAQETGKVLDDFSDASHWRVVTSNQISGSLRQVEGATGKALCLDYDYNGVSGYVGLQRDLALEYPENYRFDFQLRGDSPRNDLQFKVVDASGDNVWWVNRPMYDYPPAWTAVRYKKRHIDKAWGPDPDRTLRKSAKLEFTVYNNAGGKGSVCFDELTFTRLPPEPSTPYAPKARVLDMESGRPARNDAMASRAVDDPGANTSLIWPTGRGATTAAGAGSWRQPRVRRIEPALGCRASRHADCIRVGLRDRSFRRRHAMALGARRVRCKRWRGLDRVAGIRGALHPLEAAQGAGRTDRSRQCHGPATGVFRNAECVSQIGCQASPRAGGFRVASATSSPTGPSSGWMADWNRD